MVDDELPMRVANYREWDEGVGPTRKHFIELEGKTKRLLHWLTVISPDDDGPRPLTLIPEFQGIWMKVRITVENITEPDEG